MDSTVSLFSFCLEAAARRLTPAIVPRLEREKKTSGSRAFRDGMWKAA